MVGRGRGSVWPLVVALAFTVVMAQAAEPPRVLFLTQPAGPVATAAEQMARNLAEAGMQTATGTRLGTERPEAVVIEDDALTDETTREELLEYLRGGGAVVLWVRASLRHFEQANQFLSELGARLQGLPHAERELMLGGNPVTEGLSLTSRPALWAALSGRGVVPLAYAGEAVVMGQIRVGAGGVIVLPAELVAGSLPGEEPDAAGLTMAERAVSWANRDLPGRALPASSPATDQTKPPPGGRYLAPRAETTLPLEERDFAGAVLYDCLAGDSRWAKIQPLVQEALEKTRLPVKALRVTEEGSPLVAASESQPALVVLGSWREWSEPEIVTLHYYVQAGGRVLALGHAGTGDQVRLVFLNEALHANGLLVSLGRPGGTATVVESPVLPPGMEIGKLPPGLSVHGPGAQAVVRVEKNAAVAYAVCGQGRLLALDAGPLVDNPAYREALQKGITWLLSQES
ncbi:MAG: hypothetical protein GX100_10480 [candidate division WS1 bacterium]|nr:hypothetical protein [candidate division WS1 bacterium]